MTRGVNVGDDFTMISVLLFLLFDNLIYIVITYYVDSINPGYYAIAKPWYFPIRAFIPGEKISTKKEAIIDENDDVLVESDDIYAKRSRKLVISNVRKEYNRKIAVDNLSLNIYESQITVLLGRNGAGKRYKRL